MIRHEYETIYVTRPDLDEAQQARIDDKLKGIVENGGDLLVFEQWGKRKLAYPIRHVLQGSYQFLHYVAPAALPQELERNMNLEDTLIRFITVRLNENVDAEVARAAALAAVDGRASRLGLNAEDEDGESIGDDDTDDPHSEEG